VKLFVRLVALLLTVASALLLTLAFLLVSPQGLQWTYRFAAALAPGELSIDHLDGRLRGPLRLSGVHYHNDRIDVHLAQLDLQWRPGELVEGRLHIADLTVSDLHIRQTPTAAAAASTTTTAGGGLPDIRLPLALQIDHAGLRDLQFTGGDAAKPFKLTSVELRNAAFARGRLDLEHLAVTAPQFQVSLAGNLSPQRAYPLDLHVQWSADGGDYGTLAGRGRFTGDLGKIDVQHRLTSPFHAELRGAITDPLHNLGWQGELSWPALDLHGINPAWPMLSVAGKVHGSGDLNHVEAEGDLNSLYDKLNANHRFVVDYDHDRGVLAVRRFITTLQATGSVLAVHGTLSDLGTTPRADLAGDWQKLRWPLQGEATLHSTAGSFSITGSLADYRLRLGGDLAGRQVPNASWSIDARGQAQSLTVSRAEAQLLGGTVNASGRIDWQAAPHWLLSLQGGNLNPGSHWPQLPGKLAFTAQVDGGVSDSEVRSQVTLSRLHGELKAVPLDAEAVLSIQGDRLQLGKLRIDSGGNRLTASGTLQEQWDLAWQIKAADLGRLVPGGDGSLQGSGYITGPRLRPSFTASLAGRQLRFAANHIGALSAVLAVDSRGRIPSTVEIEARDTDFADRHVDDIQLRANGTAQQHDVQLLVTAPAAKLALAFSGRYAQPAWQGRLERLDLDTPTAGQWQLAEATPLSFQDGAARLPSPSVTPCAAQSSWASSASMIGASGNWRTLLRVRITCPRGVSAAGRGSGMRRF